jgi:hypothetical protein
VEGDVIIADNSSYGPITSGNFMQGFGGKTTYYYHDYIRNTYLISILILCQSRSAINNIDVMGLDTPGSFSLTAQKITDTSYLTVLRYNRRVEEFYMEGDEYESDNYPDFFTSVVY